MTCPECRGKGHYWERSVEERGRRERFDCPLCRSSGHTTPEAWAAHQELAKSWQSYWHVKRIEKQRE